MRKLNTDEWWGEEWYGRGGWFGGIGNVLLEVYYVYQIIYIPMNRMMIFTFEMSLAAHSYLHETQLWCTYVHTSIRDPSFLVGDQPLVIPVSTDMIRSITITMARIRIDELIMTSLLGRIILLLLLLRGRLAQLSLPDSQASRSKLDRVLRWYLRLLLA